MAIFSPQAQGITSGAGRRKVKSPYVDMIRGQQGQATQNVLAQRQEQQSMDQREEDVSFRNKQYADAVKQQKFDRAMGYQNLKLQKDANKQASKMGMIGTGISAVGAGLNAYNALGGMTGIKSGLSSFGDSLMNGFGLFS